MSIQNWPLMFPYQFFMNPNYAYGSVAYLITPITTTSTQIESRKLGQVQLKQEINQPKFSKINENYQEIFEKQDQQDSKQQIQISKIQLQKHISNINRRIWSLEEDRQLKRIAKLKKYDWKAIASQMKTRNQNQCYGRYRRLIKNKCRRGWTKQQDQILLDCVNKQGRTWKQFTKYFTNRTSKQIRERYLNNLRPNINNQRWQVEQDMKICELINLHGKKWKLFEKYLSGRTQNRIKNRYYGHIKKLCEQKLNENNIKFQSN